MKQQITSFILGIIIFLFIGINTSQAQIDTTKYKIYDVIQLKKGYPLKGEILSFNEQNGLVVFRDTKGRKYTFAKEDYDYFEENKTFEIKTKIKRKRIIKPRKEKGFEFHVGLNIGGIQTNEDLITDENYISYYYGGGSGGGDDMPVCLKLGVGKYINKQSFIGLTTDLALIKYINRYFNVGLRYQYMYNPSKNVALYFPVELKFSSLKFGAKYNTTDSIYNGFDWEYARLDTEVTLNSAEFNIGQGVSFAMKNEKSLSFELMLVRQFGLSQKFSKVYIAPPNTKFEVIGFKLSLFYNF